MTRAFTLAQLRYFEAVADCESITEAAARLNVAQSTVSTALGLLEESLGVQLFIRQPNRTLVLSSAGRRLAAENSAFLDHADALYASAQGVSNALTGSVRVGIYAPIAPFRLPGILVEFEQQYPEVQVDFFEADLATLQTALLSGECEIALMYAHGLGPEFEARLLDQVPPHVLVSAEHAAARRGRSVSLADFADEPYIRLDLPHSRKYYEDLFGIAGVRPKLRHSFTGYETVRSFVGMGHGYTLLNQWHVPQTYAGALTASLPLTDDFPPIEVVLAWPGQMRLTRRARAFAEVCEGLYRQRQQGAGGAP
ncbi:LysR substrate-binding domain-containing protein [Leucobacter sp. gxy201]|uniref:LysR family transcriptional regulator n=1 Tax=Leucobacter sp. gxy201 TaxID=2957200 RepID=UPI003D9FDF3A